MNETVTRLESADIMAIMKALPHRYPFLMIDRIINMRGDDSAIGIKNVTANEPQFLGHFPENPVFPGVLLIEGIAQTAGALCSLSHNMDTPKMVYFMTIDKAKFRKPVRPGDTVEYHVTKTAHKRNMWWYRGEAKVDGQIVAEAEVGAMLKSAMTNALIDPTARVHPGAAIGNDVSIGPYCVIGGDVVIGDGCKLASQINIEGHTTIGPRTRVAPFVSLGGAPQSTRYRGGATTLVIGADCDIRESVTMNRGTEDGGATTTVGDRCLIMVGCHIGHDCHVGNDVTFANNVVLGGHVEIGNNVFLGGQIAVHQFVSIGEGAMIAGMSGISTDVIPFGTAIGFRALLRGLNVVGMKRRGVSPSDIRRVWRAYRTLFHGDGTFEERRSVVEREFDGHPLVGKVLDFIRAPRHRALMMSERSGQSADAADAGS